VSGGYPNHDQENSPGGYHFWPAYTTALNEPLGPSVGQRRHIARDHWWEEGHCKGLITMYDKYAIIGKVIVE